jgi:hypothetical protein
MAFDGDSGDGSEPAWADDIDQVLMRCSFAMTEVIFFHRDRSAALFGDLIQAFPTGWFQGGHVALARHDGIVQPTLAPHAIGG